MTACPVVLILSRRRWPFSNERPYSPIVDRRRFVSAWNTKRARNLHRCRRDFQVALSTTFSGDEYVVIDNPVIDALSAGDTPWDADVLAELTDLAYTRAVVFTDGIGRVLHRVTRGVPPKRVGELVDIAAGGLSQMGNQLGLGTPGVCVCTFQSGVVILARSEGARVAVLADEHANLGQLLNHVRHIFPRVAT
jgi:hypothetical protein